MNPYLEQALALGLAVSQVVVDPAHVKKNFNPETEQAAAIAVMNQGCKAIATEYGYSGDMNKFGKIILSLAESKSTNLPGNLTIPLINNAFELFCLGSKEQGELLKPALFFYNAVLSKLPDIRRLRNWKPDEASEILSADGVVLTSASVPNGRRRFVPLTRIPKLLRDAVIATEDRTFYSHKGIDLNGVLRAAKDNAGSDGGKARGGGSTITQQVVKNTIFEGKFQVEKTSEERMTRKIQEIVLASQVETPGIFGKDALLSKDRILEIYFNQIYYGRSSWGIGFGAATYFGKPLDKLNLVESAFLAGVPQGPFSLDPARNIQRATLRVYNVLKAMHDTQVIDEATFKDSTKLIQPTLTAAIASAKAPSARGLRFGHYFLARAMESAEEQLQSRGRAELDLRRSPVDLRTTMEPGLQAKVEGALQEGLAQYELNHLEAGRRRAFFEKPEGNLAALVESYSKASTPAANGTTQAASPLHELAPWLRALRSGALQQSEGWLRDVQWQAAVALPLAAGRGRTVGLVDGRVMPLRSSLSDAVTKLKSYDVVFVKAPPANTPAQLAFADLRFRPQVQGAAIVMASETGRVLAMTGGFSYSHSSINRTESGRQPGSTVKPLTYLAAFATGLQPTTPIMDGPVDLPPIGGGSGERFNPRNDSPSAADGLRPLRQGLEFSINRLTGNLLKNIFPDPEASFDLVATEMRQCGLYANVPRFYPIILGPLDTTLIKLAACYAALSNNGQRPTPHFITSLSMLKRDAQGERTEKILEEDMPVTQIMAADEIAFAQLRSLLQGVVAHGTAHGLNAALADIVPRKSNAGRLADYVGGKTGTSQNANDAWFMGFTRDLTIGVWVGYDNGPGQRSRNLGAGAAGGSVAVPIFANILRASALTHPLKPLPVPSSEVLRFVDSVPTATGIEYMRKDGAPYGQSYVQ